MRQKAVLFLMILVNFLILFSAQFKTQNQMHFYPPHLVTTHAEFSELTTASLRELCTILQCNGFWSNVGLSNLPWINQPVSKPGLHKLNVFQFNWCERCFYENGWFGESLRSMECGEMMKFEQWIDFRPDSSKSIVHY